MEFRNVNNHRILRTVRFLFTSHGLICICSLYWCFDPIIGLHSSLDGLSLSHPHLLLTKSLAFRLSSETANLKDFLYAYTVVPICCDKFVAHLYLCLTLQMSGHYVTEDLATIARQIQEERLKQQQILSHKSREEIEKAKIFEQSRCYQCISGRWRRWQN